MRNAQAATELAREPLVALLAHRFLVVLEEFGLLVQLLVADRAGEVMNAPGLVQCGEHCFWEMANDVENVTLESHHRQVEGRLTPGSSEPLTVTSDDLIADEAQISKQLMIVRLAVGHATLLVVTMAKEGFLTLGTHKVLQREAKH